MKSPVIAIVMVVLSGLTLRAQDMQELAPETDALAQAVREQFALDSFKIITWSDSLRARTQVKHTLDSLELTRKLDSLRNIDVPTTGLERKLDSLQQKKDALIGEVEGKKQRLLSSTQEKLTTWKNQVREKLGLPDVTVPGVDASGLPVPDVDVPGIPSTDLPGVDGLNLTTDRLNDLGLPEMPALSMTELQNMELSPDLSAINTSLTLPELDQFKNVKEYLGKGNDALSSIGPLQDNPDAVIDQSLNNISQMGEVKEQLQLAEGIQNNEFLETAEKLKDPGALQQEVKQQVVKKAVNHFAGKEQVLQEAMEKMAKYKQKYESLNSLSELKKRPPNPMKGKPFIERVVPGVAFQILKNNDLYLDINPYFGYRLSGRFTTGIGWNQRIGYSTKENYFTSAAVVYGPRMYAEAKVWRGFSGRVELEVMNTVVPPLFKPLTPDINNREWVYSVMAGIKKEYRFIKRVKGTAFIMFNLYDPKHKSPYGDVLNSRFGFEFPMNKTKPANR